MVTLAPAVVLEAEVTKAVVEDGKGEEEDDEEEVVSGADVETVPTQADVPAASGGAPDGSAELLAAQRAELEQLRESNRAAEEQRLEVARLSSTLHEVMQRLATSESSAGEDEAQVQNEDAEVLCLLGRMYLMKLPPQYGKARTEFEGALKHDKTNLYALLGRATCRFFNDDKKKGPLHDHEGARDDLATALKLHPGAPNAVRVSPAGGPAYPLRASLVRRLEQQAAALANDKDDGDGDDVAEEDRTI